MFCEGPTVMALLSVLTPVLALVLCLVIGYMLVKSKDAEPPSSRSQSAKVDSRPWVDQEVLDDTELEQREDGKCTNQLKPPPPFSVCQF